MIKKLQISTKLEQGVKKVAAIAICLFALTNFTYGQVYDLSLINGISSSYGPDFCPGDEVRVNSAIYNVGDIEACNVEITAYIPDGMTLSENPLNSIWTVNGSVATTIITECIPPGGVYPNGGGLQLSLVSAISSTFSGTTINFYTEISADDGDDIDSTPDTDPNNDGTAIDNAIYNPSDEDDHDVAQISLSGCNSSGCTDPCAPNYDATATSDDGSCQSYSTTSCNMDICTGDVSAWDANVCGCVVTVVSVLGCTDGTAINYNPAANCNNGTCEYAPTGSGGDYDLALIKGISSSFGTEYCPGDVVRFNLAVYNQGEVEACNVEVTEYIPAGMSLSDDARNGMWSVNGSIATTTINTCIAPGGVYPNDSNFPLSIWLAIDANFTGSIIANYAEISNDDGDDIDSTTDQDPGNDAGADPSTGTDHTIFNQNGDEDDHDVAVITINPSCTAGPVIGCTDPCAPNYDASASADDGSCATYSTTCNADICAGDIAEWSQGSCGCVVITPQVLGCTDSGATNYDPAANCDNSTCTYTSSGCTDPCAPNYNSSAEEDDGSCADYSTTCNADICAGDVAEWSQDSCGCVVITPQVLGCTDSSATNYDPSANCDNDTCTYPVEDLIDISLDKTLDEGQSVISPCDDVIFTVEVCNEGNVTVYDVEVTDILPDGFQLSHGDNFGWEQTADGNYAQTIEGGIAPGECVSLKISVKPLLAADPGTYTNNAAISSMSDAGGGVAMDDNTSNNTSSQDITIVDSVFDLALIMYPIADQPSDFSPGDDVTFNISIYNRGGQTASGIDITNYIPAGMSLSSSDGNANWVDNGDGTATQTLGGSLLPCRAVSILITLTIADDAAPGVYNNFTEISGANDSSGNPGNDIDSVMDTDPTNDAGGNANSPSDNQISGDGTGFPGSNDYGSDEDDSDPAEIIVSPGLYFGNGVTNNESMRLSKAESIATLRIDRLYPTVTVSKLNLIVEASDNLSTIVQIVDFEGKVILNEVYQLKESLSNLTFNVANLPNGIYFLNTITGEQVSINKFVKN